MHLLRYTEWDGSQRIKLTADAVFEKLAEYLSYTDDVQQAFVWLLRHGLELDGVRVLGVDDFLAALRDLLREWQRQFTFDRALDRPLDRLEALLDMEREALAARGDAAAQATAAWLDRLPRRLSDALEQLRD